MLKHRFYGVHYGHSIKNLSGPGWDDSLRQAGEGLFGVSLVQYDGYIGSGQHARGHLPDLPGDYATASRERFDYPLDMALVVIAGYLGGPVDRDRADEPPFILPYRIYQE